MTIYVPTYPAILLIIKITFFSVDEIIFCFILHSSKNSRKSEKMEKNSEKYNKNVIKLIMFQLTKIKFTKKSKKSIQKDNSHLCSH